ncbi:MAG: ligase-associated DNA damage response exonuclease [Bacteroidota bacterium]
MSLLSFTNRGIYCEAGNFYIDPWRPVDRAVITHAHSDHSRWGMKHYLAHNDSLPIMRQRLGQDISVEGIEFGKSIQINGVNVSFHPAGHIIGSAQIRVEHKGEIWVASGDYKIEDDGISPAFEPVPCHAFITESTFGLPVYRWKPQAVVMEEINHWWAENAANDKASVLIAYALGKAQRIICNVDGSIGPIYTHGAVENVNELLRATGQKIPETIRVAGGMKKKEFRKALIIAPSSAMGSPWLRKFQPFSLAMASGWMNVRGARRRRAADRGFILSDHADWYGLNEAIEATGATRVHVTHGYSTLYARWLKSKGIDAYVEETQYENEGGEGDTPEDSTNT